jgi:hypothetical protein
VFFCFGEILPISYESANNKRQNMQTIDKYITEYQRLYQKQYGKEISRTSAHEEFLKLVNMMGIICQPISKEEYMSTTNQINQMKGEK